MQTLNQTIEIFDQFSFKHKALGKNQSRSNFFFGDKWDVEGLAYPLCWISKLPTVPDKSGMIIRKFQVDISDKVNRDKSNERHVLSDTEQICLDLIFYLEQIADTGDIQINIGEVSEITDYVEQRDDDVAGNYFTVELRSHVGDASCNLPIFDGTVFNNDYIYIAGSNAQCGSFVVEIKDQDGNVIQTFNTSGEYTVNILTGIQQVIGNTSTTIIQDIID